MTGFITRALFGIVPVQPFARQHVYRSGSSLSGLTPL